MSRHVPCSRCRIPAVVLFTELTEETHAADAQPANGIPLCYEHAFTAMGADGPQKWGYMLRGIMEEPAS